jgi:hypothetical protein
LLRLRWNLPASAGLCWRPANIPKISLAPGPLWEGHHENALGGSAPTPSISGLGGRRRRDAGRVATEMGLATSVGFCCLRDEHHQCDRRVVRRWRVAPVNPRNFRPANFLANLRIATDEQFEKCITSGAGSGPASGAGPTRSVANGTAGGLLTWVSRYRPRAGGSIRFGYALISGRVDPRFPSPSSHSLPRAAGTATPGAATRALSPSARSALPSATTPAGQSSDPRQQHVPTPDLFLRRPIVECDRASGEIAPVAPPLRHEGGIARHRRRSRRAQAGSPRTGQGIPESVDKSRVDPAKSREPDRPACA